MYVRLQPNFPKWFESVLLNLGPFPMDLHHSWGGPFAVEKNLLFSTQSNKKSVNLETLPVFDFCHQTPCCFLFFLILLFCFLEYDLKRGTSLFL